MTGSGNNTGRDERGRFTAGNPGGPGGARRRTLDLRRAAEEAISQEHIEAIMRRATRMALEGDLGAARLVLDRLCGKATPPPDEARPIAIDLPRLRDANDCNVALERIIDAVCNGRMEQTEADTLVKAIQIRLRAIETGEMEERLLQLERALEQADTRSN